MRESPSCRITSWWASKEVPAEDDEAGSALDTALERLTTVRQTAQAVETALDLNRDQGLGQQRGMV